MTLIIIERVKSIEYRCKLRYCIIYIIPLALGLNYAMQYGTLFPKQSYLQSCACRGQCLQQTGKAVTSSRSMLAADAQGSFK